MVGLRYSWRAYLSCCFLLAPAVALSLVAGWLSIVFLRYFWAVLCSFIFVSSFYSCEFPCFPCFVDIIIVFHFLRCFPFFFVARGLLCWMAWLFARVFVAARPMHGQIALLGGLAVCISSVSSFVTAEFVSLWRRRHRHRLSWT